MLDVQGRQLSVKGLLDTGAVVSVMPVKTWTDMGFDRSDLIPVAQNLDESDQFILGRDFVRIFDVTIDLNDGLIRIKDPERKYEKKPFKKILMNQAKVPIFLDRKVRLKPNQAVVATYRMRNLNELSNDRQVCLVPNPNSKSSAVLGRSFSFTQSGLCVSVLLNTEATTVTIQRGKKLGYALPLNTDIQSVENLKNFDVTKFSWHANQECILKRVKELKPSRKLFSMKSETDDGLSTCSNFSERSTETEVAANKPVLPELEHLKGKISDKELDSLRAVLSRNADVFSKHKADIGCCIFVEHEIEIEEGSVLKRVKEGCILKRVKELKPSRKLFSMKSETDDGLSTCSNFSERSTETEVAANKPVLPELEHLKGKISDKELDSLRAVLSRNADVFSKHKADIGCCIFVEHEIEIEEGSVPHREGARRMTPHKSEAYRKEIELLMEYDMIEPSKSPWACGVVMAKKKGRQLRFCCGFRYLNAVNIKDAYPIPRIDESLSKLGDAKFFTTLDLG